MEIIRNKNAKELARQALEILFREVGTNPVLFLSSGGASLMIVDGVDNSIFSQNFTIGVLDERFSPDPEVNNFFQLKDKLRGANHANWVDSVPVRDDTPEILASRIEDSWRIWREANPGGKVIVTMGMGVDGHTAGIFPKYSTSDVEYNTRYPMSGMWTVGYDVGAASEFSSRITATFEFLRTEVDSAIVYISSEEKRPALERVLADSGSLVETPARIFREMENVKIFTDIC